MAEQLLKAWGARPVVATVSLDASGERPRPAGAEHAQLAGLSGSGGKISWSETDDALPLPFAQWEQTWGVGPLPLVLRSSDVTEAINSEPLRVTGLKDGVYSLQLDGETVGTFNNDEFARGVNLAILDTPMTRQAKEVYDLTVSHCDVHNSRWRMVQVPLTRYEMPETRSAVTSADELEQALIAKRREVARPKEHRFAIVPVS